MLESEFEIRTGARLHFGLLDVAAPFGGLGVIVEDPQTCIRVSPAETFTVDNEIWERTEPIANRLCGLLELETLPAMRISLVHRPRPHSGFGSGTQISLCIAEGMCLAMSKTLPPARLATEVAQRGKRSAVGTHGYFCGGLIYEGADDASHGLSGIRRRLDIPEGWRVLIVLPEQIEATVAGELENQNFSRLGPASGLDTAALRHRIERHLIPAVESGDFDTFAEVLSDYNRASGMLFQSVQGGPYNGEQVTATIEQLNRMQVRGVGQSSWGPAVFAWCEDQSDADAVATKLRNEGLDVAITRPRNRGREIVDFSTPTPASAPRKPF